MGRHSNDTRPRRTALAIARREKTREITAGGKKTAPMYRRSRKEKSDKERDFGFTNLFPTLDDDLPLGHYYHYLVGADRG